MGRRYFYAAENPCGTYPHGTKSYNNQRGISLRGSGISCGDAVFGGGFRGGFQRLSVQCAFKHSLVRGVLCGKLHGGKEKAAGRSENGTFMRSDHLRGTAFRRLDICSELFRGRLFYQIVNNNGMFCDRRNYWS